MPRYHIYVELTDEYVEKHGFGATEEIEDHVQGLIDDDDDSIGVDEDDMDDDDVETDYDPD